MNKVWFFVIFQVEITQSNSSINSDTYDDYNEPNNFEDKNNINPTPILEDKEINDINELLKKVDDLSKNDKKEVMLTKNKHIAGWEDNEFNNSVCVINY